MEDLYNSLFGFLDFSEGMPPEAIFVFCIFGIMLEVMALAFASLGRIK